jgi:uncharacterized DUF497 family protein
MSETNDLDNRSAMRYNPSTVRIDEPVAFEWDEGNSGKNLAKHGVTDAEAEEVFFDTNRKLYPDPRHSQGENRRIIVGRTEAGRLLFVVFTLRGKRLRVISARDLNKTREADLYEEAT